MFKGAKLTLSSDVEKDIYMFSSHEISLSYRCSTSKYIHIKIIKGDKPKIRTYQYIQMHFEIPVCCLELLIFYF